MKFETRTAQVCAALNATGARYLVMGGTAVVLHGYVRATTDVDILIGRTLENARAVLEALRGLGYGFATEWLPEEILAKPITVIGDDPQVDIFTVAWSVKYEDAIARSSVVELDGVPVPLMSIEDLITSKKSTGRLLDQNDVEALEKIKRIRGG
ncbi:MAG: nucleotidyltransferase [Gemmatimonadales bacterium]